MSEIGEEVKKAKRNLVGKIGIFFTYIFGIIAVVLVIGIIGLSAFRLFWVTETNNYQTAYIYPMMGENKGRIEILLDPKSPDGYKHGWIVATPIINSVHTVDTRPMQVCMNANARVLNCKLVQFNPKGLATFLGWHGRDNYEGPASGTSTETPFSRILASYAFDGNSYVFMDVLRELKPDIKPSVPVQAQTGERQ